ncbi:MAG: ATP-binding cassette domain-containing protein [Planctomycetota bacterium]
MTKNSVVLVEGMSARRTGRVVFEDIDLEVKCGERVLLSGENGAGKSTLLEAILGILPSDARRREWLGVSGTPQAQRALRTREAVYLPQYGNLFQSLTLLENITVGLPSQHRPSRASVQKLARRFDGLEEALDRKPGKTSVGQRQLAACLRASLGTPRLLVLDEPTAGVAERLIPEVYDGLFERTTETAVLFTEQHVPFAQRWATRTIFLSDTVRRSDA